MEVMRGIIMSDLVNLDLKEAYLGFGFDLDRGYIRRRAVVDFQLDKDIVNIMICRQIRYREAG